MIRICTYRHVHRPVRCSLGLEFVIEHAGEPNRSICHRCGKPVEVVQSQECLAVIGGKAFPKEPQRKKSKGTSGGPRRKRKKRSAREKMEAEIRRGQRFGRPQREIRDVANFEGNRDRIPNYGKTRQKEEPWDEEA